MFVANHEIKKEPAGQGATRKILGRGGNLMMVEVTFAKDAVGALHAHPHEQVSYIGHGSFEFNLGGKKQILRRGDSVYVASGLTHGVIAREENAIIVDVFSPQREDFLKK